KTILMLGENLGIEVVAEGIETDQQLESLVDLGCRLGQGFLFSRPVSAEMVETMLANGIEKYSGMRTGNLPTAAPILEVIEIQ
ncbi:MAG: EAL domain-containing protein, partial [Acidobacteriota bacterium]